jgi:hypothetical protein
MTLLASDEHKYIVLKGFFFCVGAFTFQVSLIKNIDDEQPRLSSAIGNP